MHTPCMHTHSITSYAQHLLHTHSTYCTRTACTVYARHASSSELHAYSRHTHSITSSSERSLHLHVHTRHACICVHTCANMCIRMPGTREWALTSTALLWRPCGLWLRRGGSACWTSTCRACRQSQDRHLPTHRNPSSLSVRPRAHSIHAQTSHDRYVATCLLSYLHLRTLT